MGTNSTLIKGLFLSVFFLGCTKADPKLQLLSSLLTQSAYNVTVNQSAMQADPTNNLVLSYEVIFSKPIDVATFTGTDLFLEAGSTATVSNYVITDSGDQKKFYVTVNLSTAGITKLALTANSVSDSGNTVTFPGSTSTDNQVISDNIGPSVTINQSLTQLSDPTGSTPIYFDVLFSEPISAASFSTADIVQNGTATGVVWSITNSGNDQSFTITATSVSTSGTVQPTISGNLVLDAVGNTGYPSTSTDNVVVFDNSLPSVSGINSSTTNGSYKTAGVISIQVTFSEAVFVTGTPTLTLETGATDRDAVYTSGSGTTVLNFSYTVMAGDTSADLDYVSTTPFTLAGATIKDASNNSATLTASTPGSIGSLGYNKAIVIDTTPPTVTGVTGSTANGSFSIGQSLSLQVTFSENISITGFPTLTLETGASDAVVSATTAAGSNLNFTYTVASGNSSADLDYISTSALALAGGTIKDAAGNDAVLTLPSPASTGSLGFNKNYVINGSTAVLSISDSTTYDFGNSATSYTKEKTFTLTNSGGAAATSLAGTGLSYPFEFKGGSFPGTGGSCTGPLTAASGCTFIVTYTPVSVTTNNNTIDVSYFDGVSINHATRPIQGTGVTPASLSFSVGGNHDFGNVTVGLSIKKTITLTNSGGMTATSMTGTGLAAPYTFEGGGSFPGTSGDCGTTLAAGSSCTFVIVYNPTAAGFLSGGVDINFHNGGANVAASMALQGTGVTATVQALYPSANDWTEYVRNDGVDEFSSSGAACSASTDGPDYKACIHGGEKLKLVVDGLTSCTDLTATDSLAMFSWTCRMIGGKPTMVTWGLVPGKGLGDLISTAPAWKSNYVSVSDAGGVLFSTASSSSWWGNAIVNQTSSGSVQSLSTANTVNVIKANITHKGFNITNSHVALVVLPGFTVTYDNSGGNTCAANGTPGGTYSGFLCSGNQDYLWIEGYFKSSLGVRAYLGIFLYGSRFSTLKNVKTSDFGNSGTNLEQVTKSRISGLTSDDNLGIGLTLMNASFNDVEDVSVTNNTFDNIVFSGSNSNWSRRIKSFASSNGIYLTSGSQNNFEDIQVSGSASAGVHLASTSMQNRFNRLTVANAGGDGLYVEGSDGTTVYNSKFYNNSDNGVYSYNSNNGRFVRILATNNGGSGVHLQTGSNTVLAFITGANNAHTTSQAGLLLSALSDSVVLHVLGGHNYSGVKITSSVSGNNDFAQILASRNYLGVSIDSPSNNAGNRFVKNLSVGGNTSLNCSATGTTALNNSSCTASGLDNSSTPALGTLRLNVDIVSIFKGYVSSDDGDNPSDSNGETTYASLTDLTGWVSFAFSLRTWGKDDSGLGNFAGNAQKGRCGTGTCKIWDWRFISSATMLNRSNTVISPNSAFTPGNTCPDAVDGSNTITHSNLGTFLTNAVEDLDNPNSPNDGDGLCEQGEHCIYQPNFGAYFGEDQSTLTDTCNFVAGPAITNANIKAYSSNGAP